MGLDVKEVLLETHIVPIVDMERDVFSVCGALDIAIEDQAIGTMLTKVILRLSTMFPCRRCSMTLIIIYLMKK